MGSTGHRWTGKRWSADTEIAFLLALKLTGNIGAACREIGRSQAGLNARRRADAGFAARCQAALDEKHWEGIAAEKARIATIGGADDPFLTGAMPNQVHHDGWTPLRQRAFLRALASTGEIGKACALAGMSASSARQMRRKYPSFDKACEAALAKAVPTLEQIAVDRAVNGVSEAVWHGGKLVGQRQRYSDSLMREMLKREGGRIDGARKSKRELRRLADEACTLAGGFFSEKNASLEELADALDARFAALARWKDKRAQEQAQEPAGREEETCAEGRHRCPRRRSKTNHRAVKVRAPQANSC